jgi:hypothetical protein
MGIVVVAHPEDEHGQYLVERLGSRGHQVLRVSADSMSSGPYSWTPDTGYLADDFALDSGPWAGVWRRTGRVRLEGLDPQYEAFVRSEWTDACEGALLSSPIVWLTPLAKLRAAELKLVQLAVARRLNLPIPETLVTNNAAQASEFAQRFRCIAKPVRYGLVSVDPPRIAWTREVDAVELSNLSGPPVLLQRLIDADLHLRVITVDGSCFVAELQANELDWRSDLDNHTRFRPATGPINRLVIEGARRLATEFGLGFSSQDWVIDRRGRPYFLDANPNGQWMFVGADLCESIGSAIVHALEERLNAGYDQAHPRLSHQ